MDTEINQSDLTSINRLSLLLMSKDQCFSFCDDIVNKMENGEIDPLLIHTYIKSAEKIVNTLTDRNDKTNVRWKLATTYHDMVLQTAQRYGKKFAMFNAEFSIGEVGSKYNYEMCEDPQLEWLMFEKERVDKAVKERQEFLKTVPLSGLEIIDKETGEAYHIYPPSKISTTAVKTSLK